MSARLEIGEDRYRTVGLGRANALREGDGLASDDAVAAALNFAKARAIDWTWSVSAAVMAYLNAQIPPVPYAGRSPARACVPSAIIVERIAAVKARR